MRRAKLNLGRERQDIRREWSAIGSLQGPPIVQEHSGSSQPCQVATEDSQKQLEPRGQKPETEAGAGDWDVVRKGVIA